MPNFGSDTVGTAWFNQVGGWVVGSYFTLPEDGTVISLSSYTLHSDGSDKFKLAVYDGSASALLIESEELTAGSAGWVTGILATPTFLAAGTYFLAIFLAEPSNYVRYHTSGGSSRLDTGNTYPTLPSPGGFTSPFDDILCIYATYNIIDSGLSEGSHQSVKVDMDW